MKRERRFKQWMSKYRIGDIFVFLFFLFLSLVFWLMQNLKEDYDLEVRADLSLTGVPDDVIITTNLPPTVRATIHGQGTALYRFINGNLDPIELDFAHYDKGLEVGRVRVPLSDIRAAIDYQLSEGSRIVTLDCDTLEFFYNRGVSRRLPVRLSGSVTTTGHTYLQGIRLQPDSVDVFAPREVLDTMHYAYTQPLRQSNLEESRTYDASFVEHKGVSYGPNKIQVTADVDYITEKTIEVPVRSVGFPAGFTLSTFPQQVSVTFRVGAAQYDNVTADNLKIHLSYTELQGEGQKTARLHVDSLPPTVSDVVITPAEVEFLIKQTSSQEGGRP